LSVVSSLHPFFSFTYILPSMPSHSPFLGRQSKQQLTNKLTICQDKTDPSKKQISKEKLQERMIRSRPSDHAGKRRHQSSTAASRSLTLVRLQQEKARGEPTMEGGRRLVYDRIAVVRATTEARVGRRGTGRQHRGLCPGLALRGGMGKAVRGRRTSSASQH
jgi:hypothetical protein